jgi:hypothetical protein
MRRRSVLAGLAAGAMACASARPGAAQAPAAADGWKSYDLLRGWRIDVPRNFDVRRDLWRRELDPDRKRDEPERDWKSELVFVAQHGVGRHQAAFVSARTQPDWADLHARLDGMTDADWQRRYDEVLAGLAPLYRRNGQSIAGTTRPVRLLHRQWQAVLLTWRRQEVNPTTTVVQQLMILDRRRSIAVTASHDEARPDLRPVVERILASVRGQDESRPRPSSDLL